MKTENAEMTLDRWPPTESALTLDRALDDLRAGRTTPTRLLARCLEAVDRREESVRAWVFLDRENARRLACEADERWASGRPAGPLDGVPIGVKDIFDVTGMPTAAGASRWSDGPAAVDAPVVAALRRAGAIVLGKTVTTAYAWIDPPVTRNPWNPGRTPGGSSSGSAAAVSASMCLGAVGSQTGGSITRPAAFCGVCGLKPTYGRLSADGVVPLAPSLDHPGLIARTAGDLRILWSVVAGSKLGIADMLTPPRIGRVRGLFETRAAGCASEALDACVGNLVSAGAVVVDVALPSDFDTILTQHRLIMASEASTFHLRRFRATADDYPPRMAELIEEGAVIAEESYHHAIEVMNRARATVPASLFAGCDLIVTPAAPGLVPDLSTTGDPAFNSPWSYLGLPTASIPAALSEDGMPLAVQFVGPADSESRLLAWAVWAEGDRDDAAALDRSGPVTKT